MRHYLYGGKLYCNECAKGLGLFGEVEGPYDDSPDDYPLHCAGCGTFLENTLTEYGLQYVAECIEEGEDCDEPAAWVAEWRAFYAHELGIDPYPKQKFSEALFYDWDTLWRWLRFWHLDIVGSFIYQVEAIPPLNGVGWVYDRGKWGIKMYILSEVVPQWKLTGGVR